MQQIGRYEVLRELGRGAMDVVFKARDPFIGRAVAVKTITAVVAGNSDLLERFYREAKAAGGLQHPNIVTVYEMSESDGFPFIAMEYLEGESLEKLIARRPPLPLAQKLGYIVQACRALDYSHRRGVVHRDIKPANMVLTLEGVIKVVDFGIARIAESSNTQTGALLGTLGYMSPQQLRGQHADERADIWALGVVLYELISYERPFSGDNHGALILNILQEEPRPIRDRSPECSQELGNIVLRALCKKDAERYQTMEALLRDLEPVWSSLQRDAVQNLVREGRRLIGEGKPEEAREIFRQSLQIDTLNLTAKALFDQMNTTLGEGAISQRVREKVARAGKLLAEGLLLEARVEVESALKLNPRDSAARTIHETVQWQQGRASETRNEQQQFVSRQIRTMRSAIDRGELSNAIQLGKETLAQVGADSQVTQLIDFAERERELRASQQELNRQIREIAADLAGGKFDEARRQVETLQTTAPLDPRLVRLLEAASERRPLSASSAAELLAQSAPEPGGAVETARRSSPAFPSQSVKSSTHFPSGAPSTKFSGASPAARPESRSQFSSSSNSIPKPRAANSRWAVYITVAVVLLLAAGFFGYRKFAAPSLRPEANPAGNLQAPLPPPPGTPVAPSATSIPPASQSLEDQQRHLLDLARAAAAAKNYKAAQARLEEATKLNGPLNSMAEDLRQRFLQEARGTETLQSAREEKLLWDEAIKAMDGGRLDDAVILFRKILILPEASHRRAEAEKFVDQTIPARREGEKLWAEAHKTNESQEPGHLAALLKTLDQLLALGGPHVAEAQQMRDHVFQQFARANAKKNNLAPPKFARAEQGNFDELESQFAQAVQQGNAQALEQLEQLRQKFLAIVSSGGPLLGDARDYANILIPKAQKQIADRLAAAETGAPANAEYEKAVKDYDQALAAQNLNLLRSRVLREFEQIAQSGSPRAPEARQYATVLIPAALKPPNH